MLWPGSVRAQVLEGNHVIVRHVSDEFKNLVRMLRAIVKPGIQDGQPLPAKVSAPGSSPQAPCMQPPLAL